MQNSWSAIFTAFIVLECLGNNPGIFYCPVDIWGTLDGFVVDETGIPVI
jgi:hypothetical protein